VATKPKPPPDDPEQSARFVAMATELEAEKAKAAFGRALKKVVPSKKRDRRGSG
jgi:hypothetical protein